MKTLMKMISIVTVLINLTACAGAGPDWCRGDFTCRHLANKGYPSTGTASWSTTQRIYSNGQYTGTEIKQRF
jgi:hypothetical protein